jgi:hypothetical protein
MLNQVSGSLFHLQILQCEKTYLKFVSPGDMHSVCLDAARSQGNAN